MITELIDKQDTFEVVRDRIAQILADETESQQKLAISSGKDPDQWKFKVYTERTQPWEEWLRGGSDLDPTPRVNVSYESSSFPARTGNVVERQKSDSNYNIDILTYSESEASGAGHIPADAKAALEAQRITRLVRNIIMASPYIYLKLRGTVWGRWPMSITAYQPTTDGSAVQNVQACRLQLEVAFNELSPQLTGEVVEEIGITINRAEDGSVLAQAEYGV